MVGSFPGEPPDRVAMVQVTYRKGALIREDTYGCDVWRAHEKVSVRELEEHLGQGREEFLDWLRGHPTTDLLSIYLFDKVYLHCWGGIGSAEPSYRKRIGRLEPQVLSKGWMLFAPEGRVVEDDYSREHGLICIASQNRVHYVDPARDYLSQRVDTAAGEENQSSRWEIQEFGQTEKGRWYPRRVVFGLTEAQGDGDSESLRVTCVQRFYVISQVELSDDLLDRSHVAAAFRRVAEEKSQERAAYKEAFAEAIRVIDGRADWPEPSDLVRQYWQAQAVMDIEEMAVLWPGSTTWNRQLDDESPSEMVIGEAIQQAGGCVQVPYATKRHYEVHGTYPWRMNLTNSESKRGRFHIFSTQSYEHRAN